MSQSNYFASKLDGILGTTGKILLHRGQLLEASIVANSTPELDHEHHDNWQGGQDQWTLYLGLPAETYVSLQNINELEKNISEAMSNPLQIVSTSDFVSITITTAIETDPDWRLRINQHLSGQGISNQGRVRSDNIAAREYEGLLFRSKPEVLLYNALKRLGAIFAPLSVVIGGSTLGERPRRIEPDFIIYRDGIVTVVEIDGDLFHTESPVQAHRRLKFLLDEGLHLERISASECDTTEKAKEAAERIMEGIKKKLQVK